MKISMLVRSSIALTVLALAVSAFQQPLARKIPVAPAGQITTLYASDPLECSLDLRTGQPGLIAHNGQVFNRDSHVTMGYYPDSLAVAIQGGDTGAIVDLGTLQEAAKASSMQITGNGGNVYVAMELPWVREHPGLQETTSIAHAPIQAGHLYLGRIASEGEPDLFAKLIVLDFRPGESVTLRWQLLDE
ncbi:MAG TPA: hypothetical protein VK843_19390 [Planctomycetota bacterium]|nr:hypothetical protein [Planctomycetota bacterium]